METPSGDKGRLGGKFEGFTHTPSDGLFERIATRTEERPGALGGRFQAWEHAPNAAVWGRIEKRAHPWYTRHLWWAPAFSGLALIVGLATWQMYPVEASKASNIPALTAATQMDAPERSLACGDSAFLKTSSFFGMNQDFMQFSFGGLMFIDGYNCWQPSMGCGGVIFDGAWPNMFSGIETPSAAADSNPQTPSNTLPADSTIKTMPPAEEYYPEIELPKGNEAEGAWGFRVGTNLSQGAYANGSGPVFRKDLGLNSTALNMDNFAYTSGGDREDFSTPFVVGFTVDIPLAKRLHLLPGIAYTIMKSQRGPNLDVAATRQYIGVSVSGSYDVVKGKRGSAYVLVGTQVDAGVSASQDEKVRNAVLDPVDVMAGKHISVLAGVGVNRMISKHIGFYAQAQANSYVLQTVPNLWSQKPVWPVAQVGVKVQL